MEPPDNPNPEAISLTNITSEGNTDPENTRQNRVRIPGLKWYSPGEHRRIIKNVIIISLAFQLLFTAYLGMSNLQSSLHTEGGLGVKALSLTHVVVVISAIFLPTFLIQKLTVKWTIAYAMLGYTTFIMAQFYPHFWTLIPSAVIVGLCAAPLWASKCTYITHVGHLYAAIMGVPPAGIVVRFFGIFFLCFQSSLIWGNFISSVVLSPPAGDEEMNITNISSINSTKDTSICGVNFCPSYGIEGDVIPKPPKSQVSTLAVIYLVLNISAAALVGFCVDPLSTFNDGVPKTLKSTKATIVASLRQIGQRNQILLIPLTLWSGVNLGFYFADFSQAFVACALGVGSIGYIGMAFGISDALAAIGSGVVVRYLGRLPVFIFGALLNFTIIAILFNWKLDSSDYTFLLTISALWGIADSIWQTQINGLYGILFKDNAEAAFSNYRLWESSGFIIGFVNSNLFCVQVKLLILVGLLSLGMVGYFIVEYLEYSKTQNKE